MKHFKLLLTILLANLTFIGIAQNFEVLTPDREDHLEPVVGIFGDFDFQFEYYTKVRKILFNGLSDKPIIRFLVMPTLIYPENVLDIEYVKEEDKCYSIYQVCNKMIWSNRNNDWESIRVSRYKKEIDNKTVESLILLFKSAIYKTRFSKNVIPGNDGTDYYFSLFDGGRLKTGKIWSPYENTKMGRLVEIGNKLIEYTKTKDSHVGLNDKLKIEIENLTKEINK
ncbi:MAG: hypothetical protein JXP36_14905 [Bacteroidales bacterium]|nr:hypothetical protein [Bacteroidales bacterium]